MQVIANVMSIIRNMGLHRQGRVCAWVAIAGSAFDAMSVHCTNGNRLREASLVAKSYCTTTSRQN